MSNREGFAKQREIACALVLKESSVNDEESFTEQRAKHSIANEAVGQGHQRGWSQQG